MGIIDNLNNALDTWNQKLSEIWQIITQSPESFKGGEIWNVILTISDALKAIGLALLVLFFVAGVIRTCGSFAEIKRPEVALKIFIRFVLAKAAVTYGLDIMKNTSPISFIVKKSRHAAALLFVPYIVIVQPNSSFSLPYCMPVSLS